MPIDGLVTENLKLEVDDQSFIDRIVITWLGRADHRKPSDQLSEYLAGIADIAATAHRGIEMRFEQLNYINSASIVVLLVFIKDLLRREVRLRLVYDDQLKWQSINFGALRHLEDKLGLLEFVAESAGG